MIRHVAFFNLRPEVQTSEQTWLLGRIEKFKTLGSVKSLFLGKRLEPREEWYRPRMATDFEWMILIDFNDEKDLYAFQTDDYHLTVAREIRERSTLVKVMDFVVS